LYVSCARSTARRQSRQLQEKSQDYSGFGLKSQTPTPKSAQLASRAPPRAELSSPSCTMTHLTSLTLPECPAGRSGGVCFWYMPNVDRS
jgi:hypothetical protein